MFLDLEEVSEVETSPRKDVTVLTNGEPTAENVSVSPRKLSYFPTLDFANFWSEVRYRYSKKTDEAGLSKKNPDHPIITKTCIFRYLRIF